MISFRDNTCLLVTGGAGYVGSHTLRCLVKSGIDPEQLVVIDNLRHGHEEFLPPGAHFYHSDLTCKVDLERIFNKQSIAGVLHFAAYAYVGESMCAPGKYFENNLGGGINLLEQMVQHGCHRIVFSSSCAAYGVQRHSAIDENNPARPINPYGESKLMFERILAWYHRIHNIDSICLRYFNAAGADFGIGERHDPETHLIPLLMLTALGQREVFPIYGSDYDTPDGTCIRDFIHVSDLADAHLKAYNYLNSHRVNDVINLGSGIGVSIKQLLCSIQELSGFRIPIRKAERRLGDPPVLIANNDKARKLLGWKPMRTLDDILKSAWEWHLRERQCVHDTTHGFKMVG